MIVAIALVLIAVWIHGLTHWDGQKHCDRDCKSCPFPPCDDLDKPRK